MLYCGPQTIVLSHVGENALWDHPPGCKEELIDRPVHIPDRSVVNARPKTYYEQREEGHRDSTIRSAGLDGGMALTSEVPSEHLGVRGRQGHRRPTRRVERSGGGFAALSAG